MIDPCCPYFPVFSSPTASIEVVGNTGCVSSEKAGGGSTFVSGTTFQVMRAEFHVLRKPTLRFDYTPFATIFPAASAST